MRTFYAGFEPLTRGFHDALNGAPCDSPNMFVVVVHPDDLETIAFLIAESCERGTDLVMLHPTERGVSGSIMTAGVAFRMRCVLSLGGRFADHLCVPFVVKDKRTLLVPVDSQFDECFMMGEHGQFVRLTGRPKLEAMATGLALAKKRIEEYVAMHGAGDGLASPTRH